MKTKTKKSEAQQQEELAKQLKREYQKQWRMKNKDKVKSYADNFWTRKAAQLIQEQDESKG